MTENFHDSVAPISTSLPVGGTPTVDSPAIMAGSTISPMATNSSPAQIEVERHSPVAMVFVIMIGGILVLFGAGLGCRRYSAGMPLVSSCSAAISAACHPPEGDVGASENALLFGVVDEQGCDRASGDGEEVVGHCSFSSFDVSPPVEGRCYA